MATGRGEHLALALSSAARLRSLEPGTTVAVLTDRTDDARACLAAGAMHGLVRPAMWTARPSRSIKTRLASYSPFRQTLYLDADIVPLRPWSGIWDYLREGSIGAVLDDWTVGSSGHGKSRLRRDAIRRLGSNRAMFNGGVLLWRKGPEVDAGFEHWFAQWRRFGDVDQFALLLAEVPLHRLPDEYNDQGTGDERAAAARGAVFWHPHLHKPVSRGHEGGRPPSRWTIRRQWLQEHWDRWLGLSKRTDRTSVIWTVPRGMAEPPGVIMEAAGRLSR